MKTSEKVKCGLAIILAAGAALTAMAQYDCFGFIQIGCAESIQNPNGDGYCALEDDWGDEYYQVIEPSQQIYQTYCPVAQCGYDCDGTIYWGVDGAVGGLFCGDSVGGCDDN